MIKYPSLLRRLVLWQVAAMLVAWLVLSTWLIFRMMALGDGDLDQRTKTFASMLAETASASTDSQEQLQYRLAAAERIFINGLLRDLDSIEGYAPRYQVWSREGTLRYTSPGAAKLMMPTNGAQFVEIEIEGTSYRAVSATSSDGSTIVTMTERAEHRFSELLLKVVKVIGLSQFLILIWCISVTTLAARRGFKPFTALAQQLFNRRIGDLSPINASRLYSETAPVVQEINALLLRESTRLEIERGFLADAAHELRTPLAAIIAQTHLLTSAIDPPTRAKAVEELQQGMDRVSHLLAQLLTIARLDAIAMAAPLETIDLAELCRLQLAPLSRLARARGIKLTLEAPDTLFASVRRFGFICILDNLVDNAIRYTLSGGHVVVSLEALGSEFELQVRDDGPGIPLADRERVFERFVRLPGQIESGSGLGLAIVQRIAITEGASLQFIAGLSERGVGFALRMRQF